MIHSFKHKGLKAFASNGTTTGINPSHAKKLRKLLGTLQQVRHLGELSNGFGLHRFHSFRNAAPNSVWVIRVSPQWRLLFQWDGNARKVINLEEALQKPLFPSRIEQNCSVRFFFTTSKNGVFLPLK